MHATADCANAAGIFPAAAPACGPVAITPREEYSGRLPSMGRGHGRLHRQKRPIRYRISDTAIETTIIVTTGK